MTPLRCGLPFEGLVTLTGPGGAPMAYEYHIDVDYHKAYSHIVVQDGSGKTVHSGRVRNDWRSVAGFSTAIPTMPMQ